MSIYPPYGGHRQSHPPPPAMVMPPMHHAPRQSHQQHSQQHQQMQLQHDHNAFRHFYAAQLATLTFNSRPIIQNLSMIAQQYVHWSGIVAQCLEAHIHRVPPAMKLPSFYLLDSICKNVYQEYAHRFAPLVTNMFLDAYRSVDHATQAKMEEMLVTWRNGAPGGRELFGVTPQIDIERIVFSGHGAGPSRPQYHAPPPISKKQVLAELEVALANKERLLQTNPYDQLTMQQVDTLQQLRNMVQYTDIAPQDLAAIQAQLASLATPPQPVTPHVAPAPNAYNGHDAYAQLVSSNIPPTNAAPPSVAAVPVPGLALPAAFAALALPTSASDPNILKIYDALLKAGIVNQDSGVASKDPTPPPVRDAALETELAYEALVMSTDAATTATDITRKRPPIASLLYQRLSAQCKQCSLRFADDEAGKRALQDHLDSHFRQNRRAQQNLGRGHSRSWFVGYDDWTTEKSANGKGKKRAAAAEASAEREAKLRASFVVVPAGEEASQIPCPVCKEVLKSEFQEDEEEWIWRNAVRVGDKVYHATCHADAFVQNPLVARLKVDASSRSRSQTPDVQLAKSSSARNSLSPSSESRGVKRKAESDDVVVKQEDGTPPLKRIALAPVA